MKQIKVSETTRIQLDWLVAKCENPEWWEEFDMESDPLFALDMDDDSTYSPTTDWSQGGPIVEKELINLITTAGYPWRATVYVGGGVWIDQEGSTPLIAAMRCYVASKMGDVVEVPEELT